MTEGIWNSGVMIPLLTFHPSPIDPSSIFRRQRSPEIAHNIQKMYYAKHMNMMKNFKNDKIESRNSFFKKKHTETIEYVKK